MAARKVRYIGRGRERFVQHAVHGTITFPKGEPVTVPAELAESLVAQVDRFEAVDDTPAKKSPAKKASAKKADTAATDPEEG